MKANEGNKIVVGAMIHRLRALNQVKASVTASVTVPIGCQVITEMSTVKWFQFKRVSHVTIVLNGEKNDHESQ